MGDWGSRESGNRNASTIKTMRLIIILFINAIEMLKEDTNTLSLNGNLHTFINIAT